MTSPTSAATKSRYGFTLVELLVVIGILVLLAGILLPMVMRAMRSGDRAKASAELQAIATGMESYFQSFGDYPRFTETDLAGGKKGSELLLQALIAPGNGDGQAGPGFRKRGTQGQVYGPYLSLEKFKYTTTEIQDSYGNAILYIPARPTKPALGTAGGFIAGNANALYDTRYIDASKFSGPQAFNFLMGDQAPLPNPDGAITGGETPASTAPYILWSAGPDGTYGITTPLSAGASAAEAAKCDDVTNFR